jgi:competence ComEA-like helix-hairpin-helix protein
MSADWTGGPAKWAAVVVLGGASIFGIVWSVVGRVPREDAPRRTPPLSAPEPRALVPGLPRALEHEVPAITGLIDLNTATEVELELLPSIGPALARRIVEYRGSHGLFKSVEELDAVPGIGPAILAKVSPLVTVR